MKKDSFIDKQLDQLIENGEQPPKELLNPALALLRAENQKKAEQEKAALQRAQKRNRFVRFTAIAAACLVLLIMLPIGIRNAFKSGNNNDQSKTYQYVIEDITPVKVLENHMQGDKTISEYFPVIESVSGNEVFPEYYVYSLSGEVVLIEYKARRMAAHSIEEVSVYVELTAKKAKEFLPYDNYYLYTYSADNEYRYDQFYKDGEYYAEYYAQKAEGRYYLSVMSSLAISKNYYLQKLFL